MVQKFASLVDSEGFHQNKKMAGVYSNDKNIYYGDTYYKGKVQCVVSISYFNIAQETPVYPYTLNCGARTYPYIPTGFPVGVLPQAGG